MMEVPLTNDEPRDGPLPTLEEVRQAQVSAWYPAFARLHANPLRRTKGTVRTIIVDLPDAFRDYLLTDGIQLPCGATTSSLLPDTDDASWSSGESGEAGGDATVSFPELDAAIEAAIRDLGGSVAPKLNWSAPRDAVWINEGSLRCRTPGDVYLLLKASDFVAFDLQHATKDVQDSTEPSATIKVDSENPFPLQLALRKWCLLYPSQEFRCFVREHGLIAISQRHHSQHFPHLERDAYLMRSLIVEFFDEIVRHRYANGAVARYCFDCYIDQHERVWMLDFNVWGRRTDALLYDWDELEAWDHGDLPEIRVVETDRQVRADPLASYRAPIDAVHVASVTGGSPKAFEELMKLCQRPRGEQEEEGFDTDEDNSDNEKPSGT